MKPMDSPLSSAIYDWVEDVSSSGRVAGESHHSATCGRSIQLCSRGKSAGVTGRKEKASDCAALVGPGNELTFKA